MKARVQDSKRIVIGAGEGYHGAVAKHLWRKPSKNPMLGDSRSRKETGKPCESSAHVWARSSKQPPITRLPRFPMIGSQRIDNPLDMLKRELVTGRVLK